MDQRMKQKKREQERRAEHTRLAFRRLVLRAVRASSQDSGVVQTDVELAFWILGFVEGFVDWDSGTIADVVREHRPDLRYERGFWTPISPSEEQTP